MSDYARARFAIDVSTQSDYTNPYCHPRLELELTPDECIDCKVEADTGGTTFTTDNLTSASLLLISNLDATNYVEVRHRSVANGVTHFHTRVGAGQTYVTPDFTVSNDILLTADTASVVCRIIILGT
jgi:hypothetical protein